MLVELHRSAHLSHTAARLGMTQPALSKWLAELESDLGVPLFERQPKGLVPTVFCDALIVHARTILAEILRTQQTIEMMAQGTSGTLALGATDAAASYFVPTAIAKLHAQYPDVYVTLTEGVLQAQAQQLREGSLDYVIGRMDARVSCDSLRYDELFEDPLRVIAGSSHPLAGQQEVAWSQTRRFGWVGLPEGSQLRSELAFELAVAAEPPPRVRVETAGLLPTLAMLGRTELLGVASTRAAQYFCDRGYIAILELPYASRGSVGLLSRSNSEQTPLRKAFCECVMSLAKAGNWGAN